jgi:hypothetical protein
MYNAVIRTLVPYAVGAVVSFLTFSGLEASEELRSDLEGLLTFFVGSAYYVVALWLQNKYPSNELVKWLLGSPTKPTYKNL